MSSIDFKKLMTDAFIGNESVRELYGLSPDLTFDDQFSTVSLENIIFSNVAETMKVMQQLFDQFKIDVAQILSDQMSGTVNWYAFKAMLFQFGMDLVPESDHYDNTGLTGEQIAEMRIVRNAVAIESQDKSILYIKIATDGENGRQPLSPTQLVAFIAYLNEIQYAGTRISVINDPPDDMRLHMDIYYNPLILDEGGSRLDGTADTPVQDAIRNHLANLPFNGTYTNQGLVDVLQVIDGVEIAEIKLAASRFGAYTQFSPINAREIAHAGYYHISDENRVLNFITANGEIL